jgi:two-component system, chemotaxis family, protein-glutamate methylesterase/glutaminase
MRMATGDGARAGVPLGVIAVGGSAGGVEALRRLASGLPEDLPHALVVALHMAPGTPSVLARIIDRSGPLSATAARHGDRLERGHIYVAVPDHHLLVDDHHIVVSRGPRENGHRPALDALLRSAAVAYGPNAVGMLLSGVLDDGVLGLRAIRERGGVVVVQDPEDALFPAMPLNALSAVGVNHTVTASAAGPLFAQLAASSREETPMHSDPTMDLENRIAIGTLYPEDFDAEALGPPSGYTCPDCNGSLASVGEAGYRCRVGHAWSAHSLLLARDRETEQALWIALRSLREKAELSRRQAGIVGPGALQRRYSEIADEAEHAVKVLRDRLAALTAYTEEPPDAAS